jgi:transcriptional regulator with XRE-family HTH domain
MIHNLKFLRVQSGMTLEQLATESGLTRSYLSKIERGLSNPSIESALTIASALGVTVEKLFGQNAQHEAIEIVRAARGTAGDPTSYLSLVAGLSQRRRGMRAFIVRPTRKKTSRNTVMSHHEGEEILFVLSGEIELKIGTRVEILKKGDCAHFDSTIPHKLTARTKERAEALVVIAEIDRSK